MITIVICTRDRADALARCLAHMSEGLRGAPPAWQLVVVDNASRDGTPAVIDDFARRLPITRAFEARPGLSHARNRGIAEASHSIVAFTDDDCLVDGTWARSIVGEFERHPDVSVLGGPVELADPHDGPVSIRTCGTEERVTEVAQLFSVMSGCNMAFRRRVLDQVGAFDTALGKGLPVGSGEDVDYLYRALKRGATILYSPRIVVRHAHGRRSAASIRSVDREYLRGRGAFYCKFIGDRQIARMAYWEVSGLVRQLVTAPGRRRPLQIDARRARRRRARRASRTIGRPPWTAKSRFSASMRATAT
jgi:glycosyltransferase involved in cell wall biosynthesis